MQHPKANFERKTAVRVEQNCRNVAVALLGRRTTSESRTESCPACGETSNGARPGVLGQRILDNRVRSAFTQSGVSSPAAA